MPYDAVSSDIFLELIVNRQLTKYLSSSQLQ